MSTSLHVGSSLLPATGKRLPQATRLAAFHREGRHLLKQVANRIPLPRDSYSISSRPRSNADGRCEIVLRSATLLVVLEDHVAGARLQVARCDLGVTVPEDRKRVFGIGDLGSAPVVDAFLATCRTCLARAVDAPEPATPGTE